MSRSTTETDFSDEARALRQADLHDQFAAGWYPSFWRPHTWGFEPYKISKFHDSVSSLYRTPGVDTDRVDNLVSQCMRDGVYDIEFVSEKKG